MERQPRESWINIAKGFGIVFVVMGYVVTSYRNSNVLQDAVAFNFICDFLYVFHMPLFFVISGYLSGISKKGGPLHSALLRKCVVYGIPYLIFSVVAVGLNMLASAVVNTKLNPKDLLLIPVFPISSLWFLYALLIISVTQLSANRLLKNKASLIILLLVSFVVKIATQVIGGLEAMKTSRLTNCILFDVGRYWFWYVLGEVIAQALPAERRNALGKFSGWACAGTTLLYIGAVYALQSVNIDNILLDVVIASVGVALCCICAIKTKSCKLLEYLGKQTLPIYLLHTYVISFIRVVLTKLHIPLLAGLVPMLLCTLGGIALPIAVYEITIRIRGLDFVFYPGSYLLRPNSHEHKPVD